MKRLSGADRGHEGIPFENMLHDCVVCGLLAIDPADQIITLTGATDTAFHLPPSQKQSLSLHNLPLPVQSLVREVKQTGRSVVDRQIVLHSNSAGTVALSITAVPVTTEKENVSVVVILKDALTAGKLEKNLRRLNRLASVGTISASIAHELKNAFVAIKTFIEVHFNRSLDPELATLARREMTRADSILSQMLKFALPTPSALSRVHLHDVLEHALRLVQHRVGGRLITFNREFNAPTDLCRGDSLQLEQAFVNLLFNAVDAIGPEGTLNLRTDLITGGNRVELREGAGAAGSLRVKVTDSGGGIPPAELHRIFEPFFTTKPGGTGLGLAVTRGIVAEHQGAIHVESSPGKGTTFTILLPAQSESGSA